MKSFLIKLILFTIILAIIDFCWIRFMPVEKHIPHVWMILGFFSVTTVMFHYFSLQAAKGKAQVFIRYYMGSTAMRLFIYAIIILAYKFYDKPTLVPFAIGFMMHYFLFTVFEVPALLRELKKS